MNRETGLAAALAALIVAACGVSAAQGETKTATANGHDVSHLTEQQKYVTLHDGTEPPFDNEYWNHKEEGIYVDAISGEALFSSTDKFDSGTGWPSFWQPIGEGLMGTKTDYKIGVARTECHCATCGMHMGHVFNDGPPPTGMRWCINGIVLDFRPAE